MHYPGYDTGKIILSEGAYFPFRIHNLLQLQDDAWYFVLQDVNGLKHFMPAEFYENYGFKPGDEIICKIDRINCTGRIFLEPRHPFYSEGETYLFETAANPDSMNVAALIVKDCTGNSIEIVKSRINKSEVMEENQVRCRVKSIKKGKLILEIANDCT